MYKRSQWISYILIILLGILTYGRTLTFGYVDYDDTFLIQRDQAFLRDLSNIPKAFTRDVFAVKYYESSHAFYRPIMTLSLMIDTQIGTTNISVYRATNLLIHILCAIVLFHLMTNLGFSREIALIGSLIFTVHPVNAQAVAWVPGRNDSILALMCMLSLLFLVRFTDGYKIKDYLPHILFFLLALFTKEPAVFLIVLFILILFITHKWPEKKNILLLISGWMVSMLLWFIMRRTAVSQSPVGVSDVIKSVIINLPGFIQYTGKIFIPLNLSVYPVRIDIPIIYGLISLAIILIIVITSKIKTRKGIILLGLMWYVVFLIPALISPEPGPQSILLEHRLYLPFAGLIIGLMETRILKDLCTERLLRPLIIILLVMLISITYFRSSVYRDSLSFWKDAVRTSPTSPVAHINLGQQYFKLRDLDRAEEEAKKALSLDPETELAHNNLGIIYAVKRKFKEAEAEFRKELEINPDYEDALYNLGMIYYEQGEIEKAMKYWYRVLSINPYHIKTNKILALFYYKFGDIKRAKIHAQRLREQGIDIR